MDRRDGCGVQFWGLSLILTVTVVCSAHPETKLGVSTSSLCTVLEEYNIHFRLNLLWYCSGNIFKMDKILFTNYIQYHVYLVIYQFYECW